MKARVYFMRKFRRFALDEKLDGLLGLNHDQVALLTLGEVPLQLELQRAGDFAVQKIRDFADGFFTFQLAPPFAPFC